MHVREGEKGLGKRSCWSRYLSLTSPALRTYVLAGLPMKQNSAFLFPLSSTQKCVTHWNRKHKIIRSVCEGPISGASLELIDISVTRFQSCSQSFLLHTVAISLATICLIHISPEKNILVLSRPHQLAKSPSPF